MGKLFTAAEKGVPVKTFITAVRGRELLQAPAASGERRCRPQAPTRECISLHGGSIYCLAN
jgi:hypothetical protein